MSRWMVLMVFLLGCSSTKDAPTTDKVDGAVDAGGDTDGDIKDTGTGPCPSGQVAVYEGPGCDGANMKCVPWMEMADACDAVVFFCGCDGSVFTGVCGSSAQSLPYSKGPSFSMEGACGADGGSTTD